MPLPRTSHPVPTEPPRPTHDSPSLRELEVGFTAALEKVHNHSATRLDRIEIAIGGLTKVAKDALQMATTARQEAKEGFDRLHAVILHSAKRSLAKSERLEAILGDPDAATHEEISTTVLGRINQLELAIMELTESVSDPDAARSVTVRHEAAVGTSPQLRATVDVGVHAVDRTLSLQQSEVGIQAGLAAGTEGRSDDRQRRSAVTRSLFIPSTVHPQGRVMQVVSHVGPFTNDCLVGQYHHLYQSRLTASIRLNGGPDRMLPVCPLYCEFNLRPFTACTHMQIRPVRGRPAGCHLQSRSCCRESVTPHTLQRDPYN